MLLITIIAVIAVCSALGGDDVIVINVVFLSHGNAHKGIYCCSIDHFLHRLLSICCCCL